VLDASQPGATLRSALRQNTSLSGDTGFVIIEIGGNDLLEDCLQNSSKKNLKNSYRLSINLDGRPDV